DPESLETSGLAPTLVIQVSEQCDDEWLRSAQSVRALREGQFIKDHQSVMDDQKATYATIHEQIAGDSEFRRFLVGG
ncbi:MAG: hypothetical protein ACRCYU_10990, partial [Nocardioides sp.]